MRRRPTPLARLLALALALGTAANAHPQTLSAPIAGRAGVPSHAPGAVGAIPADFMRSLGAHLDQTALRLGGGLPGLALPSVEVQRASERGAAPGPGAAAAEYLSRAALAGTESGAAAVLARALGDPAALEKAVSSLRSAGGEAGAALAGKLEDLSRLAQASPHIRQLAADLAPSRLGDSSLSFFFDGSAPAAVAAGLRTPEEFAAYAARRFMAGRLLPGGKAGVIYPHARGRGTVPEAVPSDRELYDEVALSPLTNEEREKVVVELFRQAGAGPEEIQLQDAGDGRHNVFVVKKGRTGRTIVLGAHHDKVDAGRGTIDNWTGSAMVPNLYQALRDVDTEATLVFAVFAREEEGLIGSARFVRKLTRDELARIDAMINMDTLAVDGTFAWKNNSDKPLLKRIAAVAKAAALKVVEVVFWGGDADSTPFRDAGVPAITVFGASPDVIWDVIHSENDTIKAFSLEHYKNTYQLVLAFIKDIDVSPIGRLAAGAKDLAMRLARLFAKSRPGTGGHGPDFSKLRYDIAGGRT